MTVRTVCAQPSRAGSSLPRWHWGIGIVCCAMLLLLTTLPLTAAPLSVDTLRPLAQDTEIGDVTQPIDVIVLLDDSGSMATCWPWPQDRPPFFPPCGFPSENPPSDPDALRYSAARLLLQLADDDDRMAMVRFDNLAEGVGDAGTLQPVGAGENRRRLIEALQPPDDYFPRGYTRIDLGMQSAIEILQNVRQPGRSQYVLLLTDGEPTQPGGSGNQRERINTQIEELSNAGVTVFPVVLCNPTAGCAGEFLRDQFAESGVREATTAQDLVRIFGEIFATMKSNRSVITGRNAKGALEFITRPEHGVRKLTVVTPRGGLLNINSGTTPVLAQNVLNDAQIDVNVVEGAALAQTGAWTINTNNFSGFAIIQTDSYPQLVNPPPSIATNPASVRYYPAGKSLLLLARSSGPGANEVILYNGKTPLKPFGRSDLQMLLLDEDPGAIRLQLGNDKTPLQLERTFQVAARADLPQVQILSPSAQNSGILSDGRVRLQVGFAASTGLQGVSATVLVTDESKDEAGRGKLVYEGTMTCLDRTCADDTFVPGDGRSYQATFIVEAQKDGIRFSDWAQSDFSLKPAVYVQGLPTLLDLAQLPNDGWPLELSSGTTDPIGELSAALTLHRLESDEDVSTAKARLSEDVPEEGSLAATLGFTGLDDLRPGTYSGQLTLQAKTPAGRAMDVDIRPSSVLSVTYFIPRPAARITGEGLNFGEVLFDTSPNFRLNQTQTLPFVYEGKPFPFEMTMQESSCADITITSGELKPGDGENMLLPFKLASRGPIQPGLCSGTILISGPTNDYDIYPKEIAWQMRVNSVEWSMVTTALNLGNLQDAGAQVNATLLVRFSGKTPFVLQMEEIAAEGKNQEAEVKLSRTQLEMPPVEIAGEPNSAGLYEVPITLIARQPIVFDPMRGTFYNGTLQVGVVGLQGEPQTIGLSFISPGLAQRYLLPYLLPVYSMPAVVCTGPLTIFLLLMLVARFRGRDLDEEALEDAAMASTFSQSNAMSSEGNPFSSGLGASNEEQPVANGAAWGSNEWGSTTPNTEVDGNVFATPGYSAGSKNSDDDPWKSSW